MKQGSSRLSRLVSRELDLHSCWRPGNAHLGTLSRVVGGDISTLTGFGGARFAFSVVFINGLTLPCGKL